MSIERLRLGIVVATLTAVGGFLGHGVAWSFAGRFDGPVIADAGTAASVASIAAPDPCALLARPALFGHFPDAACGVHAGYINPPDDTSSSPAPCPTTLHLVGAVVPRTGEPFAAIVDAAGGSLLYTEGMRIGEREVAAIGPQSVVLAQDGTRCLLSMFESVRRSPA